jgi:recombination protein RecR
MIEKIPSIANLVKELQHVPYLASKNLYRIVHYILTSDEKKIQQLSTALLEAKKNIELCSLCFAWKERSASCTLCFSQERDRTILCVVETWQELLSIEKTGGYKGLYHVLGGVLCPLEGIGPNELTIRSLIDRVDETCGEVILATNQTPEGEATAAYIANKLKNKAGKITCLARGIPVGSSLEFMDRLTVYKALSERRSV